MPLLHAIAELFYPSRCGVCGQLGEAAICSLCESGFFASDSTLAEPEWRGGLDAIARLYRYEGRAEQAVRRLKYSRATLLGKPMADRLALFAQTLGVDDLDAIVPVPIHWTRRCYRGFNQSEMLCEAFDPRRVRTELLVRKKATRQQVGLDPEQRRLNLAEAFRASPAVAGMSILLVDDVITSGHTARECARTLKAAGAIQVIALAFAGN
jgi:ComF family protein